MQRAGRIRHVEEGVAVRGRAALDIEAPRPSVDCTVRPRIRGDVTMAASRAPRSNRWRRNLTNRIQQPVTQPDNIRLPRRKSGEKHQGHVGPGVAEADLALQQVGPSGMMPLPCVSGDRAIGPSLASGLAPTGAAELLVLVARALAFAFALVLALGVGALDVLGTVIGPIPFALVRGLPVHLTL